ncbi:MAG: hypothetical protein KDD60_00900 [Bdellovibrionales bacterium]|nr:hypothetical protein [Bdellovibrionales bacterium]
MSLRNRAIELAEEIATGEALYQMALQSQITELSDVVAKLGATNRRLRKEFEAIPLEDHDKRRILRLCRLAVQAGMENAEPKDLSVCTGTQASLMIEAGSHVHELGEYVATVLSVFNGEGSPTARSWFPGGADFDEVQRQRARWGNEPFEFTKDVEVDPKVALEIVNYYAEELHLSEQDARAYMEQFVGKSYC